MKRIIPLASSSRRQYLVWWQCGWRRRGCPLCVLGSASDTQGELCSVRPHVSSGSDVALTPNLLLNTAERTCCCSVDFLGRNMGAVSMCGTRLELGSWL